MANFTTTASIVALSAATLSALPTPAMADVIHAQQRMQSGAPNISFTGTVFDSSFLPGPIEHGRALPLIQQTLTSNMSQQTATFRLQTEMLLADGFLTDARLASTYSSFNWTSRFAFFNADQFDPANPGASLLSDQTILTTTVTPHRVGTHTSGRSVYEVEYGIQMPFMTEGSSPLRTYFTFASLLNADTNFLRFNIPIQSINLNDPRNVFEGATDYRYLGNPDRLLTFGTPSFRLPMSLDINTVPSPGAALMLVGASISAVARRRR